LASLSFVPGANGAGGPAHAAPTVAVACGGKGEPIFFSGCSAHRQVALSIVPALSASAIIKGPVIAVCSTAFLPARHCHVEIDSPVWFPRPNLKLKNQWEKK